MKHSSTLNDEVQNDIDLTPMLDVVFIMLIFFVITATFLNEKVLPVNTSPPLPPSETTSPQALLVTISSTNEIWVDERRIEISALRSIIAQKSGANPELAIHINAHDLASTRSYVGVMDAARTANVFNLSMKTFN